MTTKTEYGSYSVALTTIISLLLTEIGEVDDEEHKITTKGLTTQLGDLYVAMTINSKREIKQTAMLIYATVNMISITPVGILDTILEQAPESIKIPTLTFIITNNYFKMTLAGYIKGSITITEFKDQVNGLFEFETLNEMWEKLEEVAND